MSENVKVKENKNWGSLSSPRYTLTITDAVSEESIKKMNYNVLSRLIGSNDVLIEVDSSLLNLRTRERELYALQYLERIRALGTEYKYTKVASSTGPSFLATIFGAKAAPAHQILTLIPNDIWLKDEIKNIISYYGARYFIPKEKCDGTKLLEDFQKMTDDEKLENFKLSVFDIMNYNSMGIYSTSVDLGELKAMLGIA